MCFECVTSCVPSACFACVAGLVSSAFASGLRVRCHAACRVRGWACCVCGLGVCVCHALYTTKHTAVRSEQASSQLKA
eukprot:4474309-Prymnesium_polylepis.1